MFYILAQDKMTMVPVDDDDVIRVVPGYPVAGRFNVGVQNVNDYVSCETPSIYVACYASKEKVQAMMSRLAALRVQSENGVYSDYYVAPMEEDVK